MAKTTKGGPGAEGKAAPPEATKAVRLNMPASIHKRLRIAAIERDLNLEDYICESVVNQLDAEAKRRGGKA